MLAEPFHPDPRQGRGEEERQVPASEKTARRGDVEEEIECHDDTQRRPSRPDCGVGDRKPRDRNAPEDEIGNKNLTVKGPAQIGNPPETSFGETDC